MSVTQVTVGTETINVKSPKYRARMRLFGVLRKGQESGDFDPAKIPIEQVADYQVSLIAECVCDADGNKLYTPDQVDEWEPKRIGEVATAIDAAFSPSVATAEKN